MKSQFYVLGKQLALIGYTKSILHHFYFILREFVEQTNITHQKKKCLVVCIKDGTGPNLKRGLAPIS